MPQPFPAQPRPWQANAQPLQICIVGGGFGGLYTALYLQRYRHLRHSHITLVEPQARFLFTPLLYELLTDELQDWEIAPTYSRLLAGTQVQWQQDWAEDLDLQQHRVKLRGGAAIPYDYLVVATGSARRPMAVPGVTEHTWGFHTLDEALQLKTRLAQLAALDRPVAVTVIGGGASGVELAAKVADRLAHQARLTLIDRGETILQPFAVGLRRAALKALQQRQVTVMLRTQVEQITADQVIARHGAHRLTLSSDLTIWAAGSQPRGWLGRQPVLSSQRGQYLTRPTLQLVDYPEVFGLGDGAAVLTAAHRVVPLTAQAAYQAAETVAHNLAALTRQRPLQPFRYRHLGDMVTLGNGTAGVWSFGLTLDGRLGGGVRQGVYWQRLPTWRHRQQVLRHRLRQAARVLRRDGGYRAGQTEARCHPDHRRLY
jgi:NADH dehydrogenase